MAICPTKEILDYLLNPDKHAKTPEKLLQHTLVCASCKRILNNPKIQKRSALQYRNAARLLGGRANWEKRLVTESFGKDACDQALALTPAALKQTKEVLTSLFEARFTEEDRAMEILGRTEEDRAMEILGL